ncbi:hypothetical protein CHARACLAT_033253, partial [Characodon lateralis]|nr:hypothetical protein [Characodon lateralis]
RKSTKCWPPFLFIYTCWFTHTVQQTAQAFRVCVFVCVCLCVCVGSEGLGFMCFAFKQRGSGDWYKQPPDVADSSITHSCPPISLSVACRRKKHFVQTSLINKDIFIYNMSS